MSGSDGPQIVVLGASSGGVETLCRLVAELPADLPAAVFIVQHTSANAPSLLAKILARECKLPVATAVDGEPITVGTIRVAPPDLHIVLTADSVVLDRGPTQNRVRPAIDVLFRSAAAHHGARVVGVVLTGNLSDGSAGLALIKRCGGVAIVQAPDDALFPDMPRNAIAADSPDHVIPLEQIPARILDALGHPRVQAPVALEVRLEAVPGLQTGRNSIPANDRMGVREPMTCPDCGGPLWRLEEPTRFRCQIGHAYDGPVMLAAKTDEAVRALWIAVRTLDERAHLLSSMARSNRLADRTLSADQYMLRHDELRSASLSVRDLIENIERASAATTSAIADPGE
jgi:two-component system chemotaxis response regulator CheB